MAGTTLAVFENGPAAGETSEIPEPAPDTIRVPCMEMVPAYGRAAPYDRSIKTWTAVYARQCYVAGRGWIYTTRE